MLFPIFILIIIIGKTYSCICPQNTSTREIYKFNVNSSFGQEWWYFLHNVIDNNSPILSVENVWLRKNDRCNGTSLYIYQDTILYKNGTLDRNVYTNILKDNPNKDYWLVKNNKLLFKRTHEMLIKTSSKKVNITMTGYGYPQGLYKNGYVKTGSNKCDSSYTISFLNLSSKVNSHKAISYGEHVYTTQLKGTSPYSGWNCHYAHILDKRDLLEAYFLCISKFKKNNRLDPYRRALLLTKENKTNWINNFSVFPIWNWTSKKNITYPISWKINIYKDIDNYFVPLISDQEVIYLKNFYFWDGSCNIYNSKLEKIGYGFNEILET